MNAAEIVIRKMQSNRKLKVIELFGKGIRQACEPADRHSNRHVLTLHEASRDVAFARVSNSHLGYNLDDWAWGVPLSSVLAVIAIQLHKLREVHVQAKRFLDYLGVEVEAVSGQLDLIGKPFVKVGHKRSRILDGALADAERCDQLGFRIHRNEYPLVANLAVAIAYLALLLLDERPDLIALHIAALEAVQSRIQQLVAALASNLQESHDRVPVESSEPFRATDGATFNEALDSVDRSILAGTHRAKRGLGLRFGKRCRTGIAAPSLDSALAVGAKPLAGGVPASDACHGLFSACVEREKPYNEFGSGVRLTPRSGLALPTASTGDRAVSCYLVNWWRSTHVLPPSCHDRSALLPLGGSYLTPKSFLLLPARIKHLPQCFAVGIGSILIARHLVGLTLRQINNLSGFCHSRQRVMNGRSGIAEFFKIESHVTESRFNLCRCHRFFASSQSGSNCFCQPHRSQLSPFLCENVRNERPAKMPYSFFELQYLHIQYVAISYFPSQLLTQFRYLVQDGFLSHLH
jgi:hypothetical protein